MSLSLARSTPLVVLPLFPPSIPFLSFLPFLTMSTSAPPLPRAASSVVLRPSFADSAASSRSAASSLSASPIAFPSRSVSAAAAVATAAASSHLRQPMAATRQPHINHNYAHRTAAGATAGGGDNGYSSTHSPSSSSSSSASPSSLALSLPSASLSVSELSEWRGSSVSSLSSSERSIRELASGKREELRQLVGVRYRVLLETADSIERMKVEGEMAHADIEHIQTALAVLHSLHARKTSSDAATPLAAVPSGAERAPPASPAAPPSSSAPRASSVSLSDQTAPVARLSSLSLLRSVSSAPLSLLQAVRRRQWLSALSQLSDTTSLLQRLTHLDHDANAAPGSGGSSSKRSLPLLSSDWSHVLHHRASALSSLPSLLFHHAVRALHADISLDVQVAQHFKDRSNIYRHVNGERLQLLMFVCLLSCALVLVSVCVCVVQELSECVSVIALTGGLHGSAVLSLFLSARLLHCRRVLSSAAASLRTFPRSSATVVVEECVIRLAQCILLTVFHTSLLFATPPQQQQQQQHAATHGLQGKDGQTVHGTLLCQRVSVECGAVECGGCSWYCWLRY